jgi:hypothetical protein
VFVTLAAFALLALATTSAFMAAPLNGAIFTTNVACGGTNINIFTSKDAVYLNGGPAHPGAAGLPDGSYYVQVTEPGGTLLGTSVGSGNPTPVTVFGGAFLTCYQLSAIVIKASDSTPGYDDTSNGGGEYKVWVSPTSDFAQQKTDNFKVKPNESIPPQGDISVIKFYDANANGVNDDGQLITGWRMRIQDSIDFIRFTPVTITVFAPDDYTVTESDPVETNWFHTTTNPVNFSLALGEVKTVEFGNLCVGKGGGLTLGYWSNKNGAKVITGPPALLSSVEALCLRKADGSLLGNVNLATFQSFLTGANATNMANMLSAQLAAMKLNVLSGGVGGGALIYAPGTNSANSLGFATVNAVMTEANTLLCSGGSNLLIMSGNPDRPRAEALKTALDKANNNLTFVQGTPCPFTF